MGRTFAISVRVDRLDVQVRVLTEPCLWSWEILDRSDGDRVVRSSWAGQWMAYDSRDVALSAGRSGLFELLHGGPYDTQPVSGG